MKRERMSKWFVRIACAAAAAASAPAWGQGYPSRPVTVINPFGAGGPIETVVRAVAPQLEQRWKQTIVVDTRPGAGGMIGAAATAKAAPDGYTLMVTGDGPYTAHIFSKNVTVDPADLRPVAQLVWAPRLVVLHPSVPAKNVKDFVAYAKANPKKLNYGTIANTSFELEYGLFMERAGVQMTGVPYNGSGPASVALLRGDVQFLFGIASAVGAQIKDGRLVAIAVTSAQRYAPYADLPTLREAGIAYDATTNFGFWAPAKTPDEIIARIATDVAAALQTPEAAARIRQLGYEPATISGPQWAEQMRSQARDYEAMAKQLGVTPQ
jgi:tripartite-type tricarboxylate transporter receptor subunit TctC